MARRKKLSLASAIAMSNKGKVKAVGFGRVQKAPKFSILKSPTGKRHK